MAKRSPGVMHLLLTERKLGFAGCGVNENLWLQIRAAGCSFAR
jgi:hypothetical protein